MKIQINTEAALDIDELADALDSTIDCKIDGFISELDLSDEIRDAVSDQSFDYEIRSALSDYDFNEVDEIVLLHERVTNLEDTIQRIALALPNSAFDAMAETNRQLQSKYDLLEAKFKKMAGLEEDAAEDQI